MTEIDKTLETAWAAFSLPDVREHPQDFLTYSGFSAEALPPIPASLPDDFAWLAQQPVQDEFPITYEESKTGKSVAERIAMVLADDRFPIPDSFRYFITHTELHQRIRSCTACYMELPNFPVETTGSERGGLIHFLSDQQWCLHWYLYLNEAGEQRVMCSPNDYGMFPDSEPGAAPGLVKTPDGAYEISTMELWICAANFPEFIYRFWIENEIWYAKNDGKPLTPAMQAYVAEYLSRQAGG